jgi:hypothetical protein
MDFQNRPQSTELIVTSAYAEDITVFITEDEGFPHLLQTFMAYGAALKSRESTGLSVGRRRSKVNHPLDIQWNGQRVYLSNSKTGYNWKPKSEQC